MNKIIDNGPVRCCDCTGLRNCCCEAASDALRGLGFPGITCRPADTASARSCPDFEPTEECLRFFEEEAEYSCDPARFNGVRAGTDFPASM